MFLWYFLLSLALTIFIVYKILHTFVYPIKVECEECLRFFKTHPNKAKTQCKHCDTEYILKADHTLTRRKGTSFKPEPKRRFRKMKNKST